MGANPGSSTPGTGGPAAPPLPIGARALAWPAIAEHRESCPRRPKSGADQRTSGETDGRDCHTVARTPGAGGTAPATVTQKQARAPAKTRRRGERAPGNPKRHHRTEPAGEAAGATGDTEDAPRQRHEDGARGAAWPEGGRRREGAETTTSASRPRGREPRGDQRTRAPGTGPHARPLRPPACARLERKEAGLLPSPVRRPPGQGPLLGDEARDNAARARRRADRLRDTAPCPDGK